KSRGAELFGAVSVSCGEDALVLGTCDKAVLPLLRVRGIGRCFRLRAEGGERFFPGSRAAGGPEDGRAHAADHVQQPAGSAGGATPHRITGNPRPGVRILSAVPEAARRGGGA